MTPVEAGLFPLTSVADLPNVNIAFPGEHWSNRRAEAAIVPGEAVVPVNVNGKLNMRRAVAGDAADADRMAIAMRTIDYPDVNDGPASLGPNELRNRQIPAGEYVHAYYSGGFHITLAAVRAWVPGEVVGWNATGARPTGKSGTGVWDLAGGAGVIGRMFEVMEFRQVGSVAGEGILTVRSLRGQF